MELTEMREDLGRAVVQPDGDIVANEAGSWDIIYTVGEAGVAAGGCIRMALPYGFTLPQTAYPFGLGYTTVKTSREEVEVVLHLRDPRGLTGNHGMWGQYLFIEIKSGQLVAGDTVTLNYGGPRVGMSNVGVVARYLEGKAEFTVSVDPDGQRAAPEDGFYRTTEPRPRIRVLSRPPVRLFAVGPATIRCGASAPVKVGLRDDEGNAVYESEQSLTLTAAEGKEYAGGFDGGANYTFPEVEYATPGFARVAVRTADGRLEGLSNPCRCEPDGAADKLFWGDIHVMTEISAGMGRPASVYQYARDISHLDFCASTDGDLAGPAAYLSDDEWAETVEATKSFYDPGRFATILGWECHERQVAGDKNVYYRDDCSPLRRWCDLEGEQPEALWRALGGEKALTVPHHTMPGGGGRLKPWEHHHPEHQRLVEIYSCWGSSEAPDCPRAAFWPGLAENSVQAGLAKGYRLGIIASGDSHDGHPGNCDWMRLRRGVPSGLVGVYAPALTREDVFDALWDRYCYGTSGARIYLSFALNGAHMGQELRTPEDRARRALQVTTAGTAPIDRIDVIRNGALVHSHAGDGEDAAFEWADGEDFDDVALTGFDGDAFIYYYVRVVQADTEVAWSSPVWVSAS